MFLGISKTLKSMGGFRLHLGVKMNSWYGWIIMLFVGMFYLMWFSIVAAGWVLYGMFWIGWKAIKLFMCLPKNGKIVVGSVVGVLFVICIIAGLVNGKKTPPADEPAEEIIATTEFEPVTAKESTDTTTNEKANTTTTTTITTTNPTTIITTTTTTKPTTTTTTSKTETFAQASGYYILNTNTHKVHSQGCPSVSKISEENYDTYSGNLQDILTQGYEPCGRCHAK